MDEEGQWITINGTHIFLKNGETPESAFRRTTGKNLSGDDAGGSGSSYIPTSKKPGPLSPGNDLTTLTTNADKWKGQDVPILTEDVPDGQKIVVWEMENGHLHGFGTEKNDWRDDDSTPATWREYELADQGDYAASVQDFERTTISDVRVYSQEGSDKKVGAEYRRMIKKGDAAYPHDDIDDLNDEELAQKIGDEGVELP